MATALPTAEPRTASYVPPPAAEAPAAVPCANCGWTPCGDYCPRCGQEMHDLHRSLTGILGELLDAFAGWDGKIPTTLWLMVRHPGALTKEFLGGRRVRYLRPLRLYLTMSVLFFLSMSMLPTRTVGSVDPTASGSRSAAAGATRGGPARPTSKPIGGMSETEWQAFLARTKGESGSGVEPWLKHRLKGGMRTIARLPKEQRGRVMQQAFMAKVGNMVFLLLPVFAAVLRLLYRRAPIYFAEHFVFALHAHAFAMFAMTLGHLLTAATRGTSLGAVAALPLLWMPVYLFVAMRRVYGGRRRATALKFVALTLTYGPIFFIATTLTAIVAIMDLAAG